MKSVLFRRLLLAALCIGVSACSGNRVVVVEGVVDLDLRKLETQGNGCGVGFEGELPQHACFRYAGERCTLSLGCAE